MQCDIVWEARFAKWFKNQLKTLPRYGIQKRLWLLYLLVTNVEIALTMFVARVQHQPAKNASNWSTVELLYALDALYKQVAVGSIDLWHVTGKNRTNFLTKFFVAYVGCVLIKINKS